MMEYGIRYAKPKVISFCMESSVAFFNLSLIEIKIAPKIKRTSASRS